MRFFDELVKGRPVAINFMFTSCTAVCPLSTANLRKVQELVQGRLGKDVLMISISIDPQTDTPEVRGLSGPQPPLRWNTGDDGCASSLRIENPGPQTTRGVAGDIDLGGHGGEKR